MFPIWAKQAAEQGLGGTNQQSNFCRGFYETAGIVKVFVFAFVFSLLAFLLLLLSFVRVWKIHLGLLYALV
jgi:hypothetical protein